MTESEMDSMLHYHLTLVQEFGGTSVTEEIGVDSHRVCLQNTRHELFAAFEILGYRLTFSGNGHAGHEIVRMEFQHGDGGTVEFVVSPDCACHEGSVKVAEALANL